MRDYFRGRARRGNVTAMTAICMIPLCGLLALVLDGGLLFAERRHAQAVSDATALASANVLYTNYGNNNGNDPGHQARNAGLSIASDNGYTNDGTTSTVTINIPPASGLFQGKSGYAEALVQQNQPKLFSALWGSGTMSVTARSVARGMSSPSSPAILLLDPSMAKALNVTGNGPVTVTGGSIVVDSTNSQAGNLTGNGNVSAPNINITGSYNTTGSGHFIGTIKTLVPPTPDPLASLVIPDPSTMTVQSTSQYQISNSGTYTLQPGVYKGGIAISAPSGQITMASGIFYMQGGGFSNSGGINMSGSGVMIYNAPSSPNDQIKLTGSGSLTLSPMTSGTWKGMELFQDRTSTATVTITGNGSMNISGTIYSAKAEIDVTGNGGANVVGSQIIANNMKVTGNGPVNVNYNGSGSPQRDIRLVE